MPSAPRLNPTGSRIEVYASKAIAKMAKADEDIANLSIGEPEFGPPNFLKETIASEDLTYDSFLHSVKQYEQSLGSPALRRSIADWYQRRYGLEVNPETEILITHGGVEAIALSLLCTTNYNEAVLLTDPTYMLYSRVAHSTNRLPINLSRSASKEYLSIHESVGAFVYANPNVAKAIVVNSPENPTGYVLSGDDWRAVTSLAEQHNLWIIHDEVYDTMSFGRKHTPVRCFEAVRDRAILVNSFSKKFGVPGLRIGWLCGPAEFIALAAKLHDYFYLGVNILFERIATRMLQDARIDPWLDTQRQLLAGRAQFMVSNLGSGAGFEWPRLPHGGMFAFPSVRHIYEALPIGYKSNTRTIAESVAEFFVREKRVASVPGSIYGPEGNECVRFVLCTSDATFRTAVTRLAT